jgi:hypothetical protein
MIGGDKRQQQLVGTATWGKIGDSVIGIYREPCFLLSDTFFLYFALY